MSRAYGASAEAARFGASMASAPAGYGSDHGFSPERSPQKSDVVMTARPWDGYTSPYFSQHETIGSRSMFGAQYLSQKGSAPSYRFGKEDRPSPIRLAAKAANPGPCEYKNTNGLGPQATSDKPNAAVVNFTKDRRFKSALWAEDASKLPGPATYNNSSGLGPQVLAGRCSSASFSLSSRQTSRERSRGPGPCYLLQDSLGMQTQANRASAPSFQFGSRKRFPPSNRGRSTVGPGSYGSMSSLGTQAISAKPSNAAYGFGSCTRLTRAKVYLSPAHEKTLFGQGSPGPQAYGLGRSSMGAQYVSKASTAPTFSFSKAARFGGGSPGRRPTQNNSANRPGPGSYLV